MELATQIDDLTPEAQEALSNELQQRKIHHDDVEDHVVQKEIQNLQKMITLPKVSEDRIRSKLQAGARCIRYQYCISCLFWSFKQTSSVKFINPGESYVSPGIKYSLVSLLLGWWGIPWGPIWTVSTLINNFRGGCDITEEVWRIVSQDDASWEKERKKRMGSRSTCPACGKGILPGATRCKHCGSAFNL